MPPKRKSNSTKTSKLPLKKTKSQEARDETLRNLQAVKETKAHKVDTHFPGSPDLTYTVHDDFDCMLNQTNIDHNNNKFYIIQLLDAKKGKSQKFVVWTRWGRVGEVGQSSQLGPFDKFEAAVTAFEKKFTDKTSNKWSNRENFTPRAGKYVLLDIVDTEATEIKVDERKSNDEEDCEESKLDKQTKSLIQRIFDDKMFEYSMQQMNLDVKKMPLGQLSAKQISTAFGVLDELQKVLKGEEKGDLNQLSSQFYSVVPHNFGRDRPPAIKTEQMLREKFDLLNTLSDVVLGKQLQKESETKPKSKEKLKPNPWDAKYEVLKCNLKWMSENDSERKLIEEFFKNTGSTYYKINNVWRAERSGEDARFKRFEKLNNHKLLWHGTNVAVVAAILKTGLRIMPHSGGRVGKGIYLASQAAKSQGYCRSDMQGHNIMFLIQAALGKEHHIYQDDSSLTKPPPGFDSVIAIGTRESDPTDARKLNIRGKEVIIPYGKPKQRQMKSSFYDGEYLLYDEAQCSIRYVIEFKSK